MSGINGPSTTYLLRSSGRPRLVVDSGTVNIVERIDYDEFGNIINDTNPGFQPSLDLKPPGFDSGFLSRETPQTQRDLVRIPGEISISTDSRRIRNLFPNLQALLISRTRFSVFL